MTTFISQTVPDIQQKQQKEGRKLVFQDECAVRLLPCVKTTYAPIGQTPVLECDSQNKQYVSVCGAISADGYAYFEVREAEGFKRKGLTRFLTNAWVAAKTPLLMVWDGAPAHTSHTVRDYLKAQNPTKPLIWLAQLPPYSPELNPIEQVWAWLKGSLANQFFSTTAALKKAVLEKIQKLQNDQELLQSFFRHKDLACYQFSI